MPDLLPLYERLRALEWREARREMTGFEPEVRAALWRLHAETYLKEHPNLSLEQIEVIRHGVLMISKPDWFGLSFDRAVKNQEYDALRHRAELVFSPGEIYEIFITLGNSLPAQGACETLRT